MKIKTIFKLKTWENLEFFIEEWTELDFSNDILEIENYIIFVNNILYAKMEQIYKPTYGKEEYLKDICNIRIDK